MDELAEAMDKDNDGGGGVKERAKEVRECGLCVLVAMHVAYIWR